MAEDGVVDLNAPKCRFSRIDYDGRLSLCKIGDRKYVVVDLLIGCSTQPLEGDLELVTAGELATVIDIHTHDMTDLFELRETDVIRDGDGLAESWLCSLSSKQKYVIQKSFEDLASHCEPGSG